MALLEYVQCDITTVSVDAVVNAANTTLLGGGGVDGAIHRAAGPSLLAACIKLGGCEAGSAKITKGFRLPAQFVIHAVGPVWRGGYHGEKEQLADCYRAACSFALEYPIASIAFPCISTGMYRFPKDEAAAIAVKTIREETSKIDSLKRIVFVCFAQENLTLYQSLLEQKEDYE